MKKEVQKNLSRRVSPEDAASLAEVTSAANQLTDADLLRLEKYAIWRIRGLGRRACGRNHEDLMCEAVTATLEGRRSWNKQNVNFVGHLLGAMHSISDNWAKRFNDNEPILESDFTSAFSSDNSGLADIYTTQPTQEDELFARQQEELIKGLFEGDPLITLIICELKEGMKLRDIKEKYQIEDNDYEAALKRMRRKLNRFYEEERNAG